MSTEAVNNRQLTDRGMREASRVSQSMSTIGSSLQDFVRETENLVSGISEEVESKSSFQNIQRNIQNTLETQERELQRQMAEASEKEKREMLTNLITLFRSKDNTFERVLEVLPENNRQQLRSARNTFRGIQRFGIGSGSDLTDIFRAREINEIGKEDFQKILLLGTIVIIGNGLLRLVDIEDEKHIPNSSNFNGAGTKVEDRVGITLDPNSKIGTKPYHIPTDLNDLLASIHDFAYFENNNLDRMYADYSYYYNNAYPKQIFNQLLSYGLIKDKNDLKELESNWKKSDTTSGRMLGLASFLRFIGIPESAKKTLDPREVIYRSILPAFYNYRDLLLPSYFPNYRRHVITPKTFALSLLPDWNRIIVSAGEKTKDTIDRLMFGKEKMFHKYHNNVVEKWLKYLGSVGSFDKSGVFVLKAKSDKDETLKDYKDFIEEFNDMVRVSDYPEKIANTEFNEQQAEQITNPTRDEGSVKPSGLGFGTILGWFDFDSWEDRFMYKDYGYHPIEPSPTPIEPSPTLSPINTDDLNKSTDVDVEVEIPITPSYFPRPSPTPTITTTTTTTTPSPTPTTTTPSPTISITEEDLGKFPAEREIDITPKEETGEIVISSDDL
jgi:hypothetical protein